MTGPAAWSPGGRGRLRPAAPGTGLVLQMHRPQGWSSFPDRMRPLQSHASCTALGSLLPRRPSRLLLRRGRAAWLGVAFPAPSRGDPRSRPPPPLTLTEISFHSHGSLVLSGAVPLPLPGVPRSTRARRSVCCDSFSRSYLEFV